MQFLYTLLIYLYKTSITFASIFHKKAKLKVKGIKKSKSDIYDFISTNQDELIFIHCSSQGEHEQAQPIIRWIIDNTNLKIVLSFYSPSGYVNVNYENNPRIIKIYLPFDTPSAMSNLLSAIKPKIAIIIKNEWWWNLLYELSFQKIDTYLISATIRKSHYFINNPNSFFINGLNAFSIIFVIDEESKVNISKIFNGKICITRDTRIDQVNYIKSQQVQDYENNQINKSGLTIVYGSIWESDLESIKKIIDLYPDDTHLIYPHELGSNNIRKLTDYFQNARLLKHTRDAVKGVNIITSMGELKYAYHLATFAYIGGGFGAGIHNVLEAAVYNIPTLFGSNFQKSNEAKFLILNKCSFTFNKVNELKGICKKMNKEKNRKEIDTKLKSYFSPKYSPTEIICQEIFKKKK